MTTSTFTQTPVTTNTPREKVEVANERLISLEILTETLKVFNRLMLQSTINDSTDDRSNKDVVERYPKIDTLVDTCTSDRKNGKLLILTLAKEVLHTNY